MQQLCVGYQKISAWIALSQRSLRTHVRPRWSDKVLMPDSYDQSRSQGWAIFSLDNVVHDLTNVISAIEEVAWKEGTR